MAKFVEARPKSVHQLRALVDQPLSSAKQDGTALLFRRLRLDETHFWPLCSDHYGFGIHRVVLLPLDERLHVMRSDQLHVVSAPAHLARPVMRAAARFHDNNGGRLLGHEISETLPRLRGDNYDGRLSGDYDGR